MFYETSSYGRDGPARREIVGAEQLLYGSTGRSSSPPSTACRPGATGTPIVEGTRRALGERAGAGFRTAPARGGSSPAIERRASLGDALAPARARSVRRPSSQEFVGELADRPELWIDRVKHDRRSASTRSCSATHT